MKFDWLIVGAGFTGATFAQRLASELNQRVLIIDRRPHIGGNAYDGPDEQGTLVHWYGAHIFHTNSTRVWNYLSQFTRWEPYEHHVLAMVDGQTIPIPFNLNTLRAMFPDAQAKQLEAHLIDTYGWNAKIPILEMRQTSDISLRSLADIVYDKMIYGYTTKQWGLTPEQLAPSVTGRVPIRVSHDNRYFQDTYQAMPRPSYTALFERMLDHPNIQVKLNMSFDDLHRIQWTRMVYTGPIDQYFGYRFGHLPYRSLRFEHEKLAIERFQPVAVVNYPNDHDYTRIIEQKYLTGQTGSSTTIVREYPQAHEPGINEPYYPIPREENRRQYVRYQTEAKKLEGKVLFAGRLADYQYYNMDQVVARALTLFDKLRH